MPPATSRRIWPFVLILFIGQVLFGQGVSQLLRSSKDFSHFYSTPVGFGICLVMLPLWLVGIALYYNLVVFKIPLRELIPWKEANQTGALFASACCGFIYALLISTAAHLLNPKLFLFRHFSVFNLFGVVTVPLEELVFRGFLFVLLIRKYSFGRTTAILTLLNTAFHLRNLNQPLLLFLAIAGLNIGAILLRHRHRSLGAPICFHAVYNMVIATI